MTKTPRIVSLCPSNTEILFTLGLLPYVVGIDNYSDFPADLLLSIPRLGPDLQIDIAKMVSLKPDIIFSSLSVPGMEKVVEGVEKTGILQYVLTPHSVTDILHDTMAVAEACSPWFPDIVQQAQRITSFLERRVTKVKTATDSLSYRPSLYWEWWPKPIYSPAKNNWLTEISELAGGRNIFAMESADQICCDDERVIKEDPDYFLAVWTGVAQNKVPLEKIKTRQAWQRTKCFQSRQLYILCEGLFCRPSPRLMSGLEQLACILHPQLVRELELPLPHHVAPIRQWSGHWMGELT